MVGKFTLIFYANHTVRYTFHFYIYNITNNIIFNFFIFRQDYEPINEFHHNNMHVNNGNVTYDDPRPGLGIHRGVANPNENFQLLRPNNHDVPFINDNAEYDEIEDEGEDIDQIHHDIDDDEEDDYPDANQRIDHHRRNNHFNHHRRLSN